MVVEYNDNYGKEQENNEKFDKTMWKFFQNDGSWLYANVEVKTCAKTKLAKSKVQDYFSMWHIHLW